MTKDSEMPYPTFYTIFNANGESVRGLTAPTGSDCPDQSVKVSVISVILLCKCCLLQEFWLPVFKDSFEVVQLCKPRSDC